MKRLLDRDELLELLRRRIRSTGAGTQADWAVRNGLSAAYVSDVLNQRRDPGWGILAALRVERVVAYRAVERKP